MPVSLPEKRLRNRTLCALYTPAAYPGYAANRSSLIAADTHKRITESRPFSGSLGDSIDAADSLSKSYTEPSAKSTHSILFSPTRSTKLTPNSQRYAWLTTSPKPATAYLTNGTNGKHEMNGVDESNRSTLKPPYSPFKNGSVFNGSSRNSISKDRPQRAVFNLYSPPPVEDDCTNTCTLYPAKPNRFETTFNNNSLKDNETNFQSRKLLTSTSHPGYTNGVSVSPLSPVKDSPITEKITTFPVSPERQTASPPSYRKRSIGARETSPNAAAPEPPVICCNGHLTLSAAPTAKSIRERRRKNISKTSSGYGSYSSESDSEASKVESGGLLNGGAPQLQRLVEAPLSECGEMMSRVIMRESRTENDRSRAEKRAQARQRRQSVPANLREFYTDEVFRVFSSGGLTLSSYAEEGPDCSETQAARGIKHPVTVLQLSRKFSATQAKQERLQYKMDDIADIQDANLLSQMLDECEDPDKRKAIRGRIQEIRKAGRAAADKRLQEIESSSQMRIKQKVADNIQRQNRVLATNEEFHKTGKLNMDTYTGDKNHTNKEPKGADHKENYRPGSHSGPPTPVHIKYDDSRKSPSKVGGIAALSHSATAPAKPTTVSHIMSQAATQNKFKQMDAQASANKPKNNAIRSPSSIKDALIRWCQSKTTEYPNVNITNMSSSWADGMAFCALIHHFRPNAFDFNVLDPKNREANFELAFRVAEEQAEIYPLLDVEDMILMGDKPDWKCVFTYVQSFYNRFRDED